VNFYKEWLRGQNHNDSFLLSGVSGHGARSFYYPKAAQKNCNNCHMPLLPSNDFGAKDFDGSGVRKVHSHIFIGANTGVHYLTRHPDREEIAKAHEGFLKDRQLRIDLFGVKQGGTIDGEVTVLRPELPKLEPGKSYLVEVVIRTLTVGHHFTQGTVDSNEVWVEFLARSGGKVIGRSGAIDKDGQVDEWSHFLNVLMLDRNGNRIDRRNPQDIFTPLYDHQVPPGAGQVVHYKLDVPKDVTGPVELSVKLRYRKFDHAYMKLVHQGGPVPVLPVVDICEDKVTLPVAGVAEKVPEQTSPIQPAWQRWNDYGIGCFLEGGAGSKKGELKQAEAAFRTVAALGDKEARFHGNLNRARVLIDEGRLDEAVEALTKARAADPETWWNVAWFTGLVDAQNGHLDKAITTFEKILDPANQPTARGFDFTKDYVVINELGKTLFLRAQQESDDSPERDALLRRAVDRFRQTLAIEPEDLEAHFGLARCYDQLGHRAPDAAADQEERPKFGAAREGPADPKELVKLAGTLADAKAPREERLEAAAKLATGVEAYGRAPFQPKKPKAPTFRALLEKCRPVAEGGDDALLRAAAYRVLGRVHRQLHGVYKIDEHAKNVAVQTYRKNHPAADAAAEAVVIYRTDR
ncbi:MAG TPA: tetratricopeptide repeat protein, partial [Gemmataceae bacterium]|nr:tetratricopeptide repeat protein [Gemmataceae bacterium]